MRHLPSDKYSIAWFKLAECIARGEKEKAYGVYRLLAHSLADQAYAYQLEGDLLRCFEDQRAFEKYRLAVHTYYQEQRWLEVAGIGEHLHALNELSIPLYELLVEAHMQLKNRERAAQLLHELLLAYIEHHQYELVSERFVRFLSLCTVKTIEKAKAIIFKGIEQNAPAPCIKEWLRSYIDAVLELCEDDLTSFMSELAARSPSYARIAERMLVKN